jgi:hypothetical protein
VVAAATVAPVSVEVTLDRLREECERRGSFAFVLTVSDAGRPHVTATTVGWEAQELVVSVGARTARNATERPDVALLWPVADAEGFSLIVDGAAGPVPEGGGPLAIRPTKAVLHRSRPGPDGAGASDCQTLLPRSS